MRLMTRQGPMRPTFSVAQVTYSDSSGYGALGESEKRHMPVAGPRGMHWVPCEGDSLLLAHENGVDICLGVLAQPVLVPGEICLTTPGGAVLHLKNNGEIRLNDLVIPPPGQSDS